MNAPTHAPSPAPDRTRMARIGLVLIGLSLLLRPNPIGLLPVLLSLFLPRFRVLGWWICVVLTLLLLSITVGTSLTVVREFRGWYATNPSSALWLVAVMSLCLLGCFLALGGLIAPGTRRAVERRTTEVAPHAFDEAR